jgi:cobalt-zinc-cadmium efflux system membrane fusion protein
MIRGKARHSAVVLALPILLLSACDSSTDSGKGAVSKAEAAETTSASKGGAPDIVTASEEMLRQLVIKPVGAAPISRTERIAGRVDFDQQHVARIGANVTGRVTDLNAALGQVVKAGDLLAQLHSTELGNSQLAYLRARAQAELHRRNVERAKVLFDSDVIGSAELQKRESELSIAEAEMRAAADQLRVQGMSARSIESMGKSGAINSISQVIATAPGVVVERNVALGEVIQPAAALFTVADLSKVWVLAEVPEHQVSSVQVGQRVLIEVPALGNRSLEGQLVYVGDIVNPERRTVTVRTKVDNTDRSLKPAMLATMLIESNPEEKLVVPASAVVTENNETYVLREQDKGRFQMAKVSLGPEYDGMRTVENGLKQGDKVVTEGAFHLNNERKRMLLSE